MRSVLEHLVEEEGITDDFVHKLFSWKPSGFSVDNKVRITAGDAQGRKQTCALHDPHIFTLEKMEYKTKQCVGVTE